MKSLKVILPECKEKKPFKTGGKFYEDPNFNPMKMTPSSILKRVKATNKPLGIHEYISLISINDQGDYYTVSCC